MYRSGAGGGTHSILRPSSSRHQQQPHNGANPRREKRTSFKSDNLHQNGGNRGLPESSMASVASMASSASIGIESEFDQINPIPRTSHKPFWQIARPQLQTPNEEDLQLVSMSNVERGSSRHSLTNNPGVGRRRPIFCSPSERRILCIEAVVNSSTWNIFVLLFTFLLLFGSPLQLFLNSEADEPFDIIFLVSILHLTVDIILTALVDPAYFPLYWKSWREFNCGSFLFWFDVIGVGSLLYSLSFVHGALIEPVVITIDISNEATYGERRLININIVLLWTVVLRTMKIARFLSISAVVNFANNISMKTRWRVSTNFDKFKRPACLKNFSFRRKNQNRTLIFTNSRMNSQQSVSQRHDPMSFNNLVEEAAAIRIQKFWHTYKDSEDMNDQSVRMSKHKKNEARIARLKGHHEYQRRSSFASAHNSGRQSILRPSRARRKRRAKVNRCSEIGLAMNYITTKRVAVGVILSMFLPLLFSNQEKDTTEHMSMVALHHNLVFAYNNPDEFMKDGTFTEDAKSFVETAFPIKSNKLFYLTFSEGNCTSYEQKYNFSRSTTGYEEGAKTDYETKFSGNQQIRIIEVCNEGFKTEGTFDAWDLHLYLGLASLGFILFFLAIWFFGLLVFACPVTTLVVIPIERMIRLLGMLVKDPLGYENSDVFQTFVSEEDDLAHNTFFTKDNLKGMETEFLMNSILRIGSLMKVGFGAAGVQIIRDSMRKKKKTISTVSCIFLFCDIRQFTDTSECLQEEIFLFTNKIAEVVHSICHSFGGFANQNKGDAFLVIWKLQAGPNELNALNKEADSALFSVVQICMALNYESFFLSVLSQDARTNLKNKFGDRDGNMIQIGFGLHAGMAVEGAIGSTRKLDATYLSNEVELAEFLESSTKKYGVSLLMSGKFYHLLHPINQRQCRQVDEAFFPVESADEEMDDELVDIDQEESEFFMRIYTYDFDLEMLRNQNDEHSDAQSVQSSVSLSEKSLVGELRLSSGNSRRSIFGGPPSFSKRKKPFMRRLSILGLRGHVQEAVPENFVADFKDDKPRVSDELTLPTDPVRYHSSLWKADNILKIRQKYTPMFLYKYNLGLTAYLDGYWSQAKTHLTFMVQRYNDEPSKVLLAKMSSSNDIPPYKHRFHLGRIS